MNFQVSLPAIRSARRFLRVLAPVGLLGLVCLAASAQTSSACNTASTSPSLAASAGLAEQIGNIVITCTGGTSNSLLIGSLYITLNTNITNALDTNANPLGITIASSGATVTEDSPVLTSASTLAITNVTYTVPSPAASFVIITISGIRASVASVQNAQPGTVVNATVVGIGLNFPNLQFPVALGNTQFLSSILNNGINCNGSALPATADFPTFISSGTVSSAVRITEASATAFAPLGVGATNGTRILVQMSGYPAGAQLWVPSTLVGNSGSVPTSAGQFASSIAGGTYTPHANQLLLSLVSGADQNGVGGTLVTPLPGAGTSFTAMSQLTVSNGSAYAVYEVLDDNPYVQEAVQVPVFVVNGQTNCNAPVQATLSATEAPISTVSIATATDPIPRYASVALASDCQQTGDCSQNYFPVLSLDTTPISLTGNAQGLPQTASVALLNNGGSMLSYTASVAYQSGSGWLAVTPAADDVASGITLSVVADPTLLQPGTYNATVAVNGGEAGAASIPVTFTVGPAGVTIRAIVSAASFQSGITPGSYVAMFGSLLAGKNVSVTFNNQPAMVIYDSAGQINLIIPASLQPQSGVAVVATVDGQTSNGYSATLLANSPGIFNPGILNSDSSVNSAANPAARGSFIQIYLTGLTIPVTGALSVTMGAQTGIAPLPGQTYATVLPALNQVNVTIPSSFVLTGNSTPVSVCIASLPGAAPTCSNSVNLYLQ